MVGEPQLGQGAGMDLDSVDTRGPQLDQKMRKCVFGPAAGL